MKALIRSVDGELDCGCDQTVGLDDLLVYPLIGPHVAATIDLPPPAGPDPNGRISLVFITRV